MKTWKQAVPLAILATGLIHPLEAQAAEWPDRPVRMIVAYPAGGGLDFVTRVLAQQLAKKTGQSFVVENRSGASGAIGADAVVKSEPDGYTLLVASPAEVLVSAIAGQKMPYDTQRDLAPVTLAGETPLVVAAHPAVKADSMAELLEQARADPKAFSYGTPGNGSSMHFAGESINMIANVSILHVPYKGAAPALADLLGNQIPVGIVGMPPTVAHQKSGKLKILAVTGEKRSSAMPDVPAMAEIDGFEGYRYTNWMGVYVPAATPPATVSELADAIDGVLRQEDTRKMLLAQGVEPIGNGPKAFAAFLDAERKRYEKVARERNIKIP
ncbi:Bug family tripartite tricarboxylate transporter substrate binding protein [Bordetella petrii]|uniref:Bug family tripartite tricarboxylate transporter substrate binding protein n=1 Tax=Bordetella petrii TaxID=94624 RepID=UPI001E3970EB|nr:tripartite tricarboxylate transporter substrate binding protein [Bordetella petrii]MCD0504648.1 tripartite tricarboxylate transporter substrate binding protein [Bordetella petrii]